MGINQQSELGHVHRRPRRPVMADVTVVDGCGRQLQSRLWNISDEGFMAECEEKLPRGAIVSIDLPGRGPVRAEVRWVLGWRFGAMIVGEDRSPPLRSR